jgi:hypothetical protein
VILRNPSTLCFAPNWSLTRRICSNSLPRKYLPFLPQFGLEYLQLTNPEFDVHVL